MHTAYIQITGARENNLKDVSLRNLLPSYGAPDVDAIENISEAIVIDQKPLRGSSRSTVGTAGHTVLVVEHAPDVIVIADHVVDLGPRAGAHGGEIVYQSTVVTSARPDTHWPAPAPPAAAQDHPARAPPVSPRR